MGTGAGFGVTEKGSRPPSEKGSRPPFRRQYVDWARGLAVLVMIESHTLDSWTRAAARSTTAFRTAAIAGGFAAPLFLWLAGVAVALAAAGVARREGRRAPAVEAIGRRGLEVFILAFLFRLQAFLVSPGSHPVTLFRVDILNVMGPAIVAAGVVWGLSARTGTRVVACAAIAAAFAMVTPIVRASAIVDLWPTWLQWYVRPAGEHTTFTLFPWAGFVFAGAASGVLIAEVREPAAERRLHVRLAGAGALVAAAGFYTATRPSIYRQSSFWTSSPTYFAIRVGLLMLVLAALYALEQLADRRGVELRPLARLGRSSLFVYWIHVELVYGYASWFWWRTLPLWGTFAAYAAFSVLMYAAVVWRDRLVEAWRRRRGTGPQPQPAAA